MSPHVLWRETVSEHRRWLFFNTVVIAAVVNAALNALIAWVSAANEEEIPLWAVPFAEGPSLAVDTIGTFFILPFLTTLLSRRLSGTSCAREGSRRSRSGRPDCSRAFPPRGCDAAPISA